MVLPSFGRLYLLFRPVLWPFNLNRSIKKVYHHVFLFFSVQSDLYLLKKDHGNMVFKNREL